MDRSFELRELFHLHFLRHLGPRLVGRPYAVKGGIGLRFFHRSPRLSEDIDLDVAPALPVHTLQRAVDGVLAGAALSASLVPHGIGRLLVSRPKQTAITQRWKVSLVPAGGLALSTRIEFSRRRKMIDAQSGVPDAELLRRYHLMPFAVQFYPAAAMAAQKIAALASPSRTAARDLFDLHHLFFIIGVNLDRDDAPRETLEPAVEKVRQFEYPDFRDQVLPYLPDDLTGHYGNASAFEHLRMQVEEKLAGLMA